MGEIVLQQSNDNNINMMRRFQFSDRPDGQAHVVVAGAGQHVHVRIGVRHQPGAGATVPDHEGLRDGGAHAVVQLADHRVHVAVHVLRGAGRVHQVPGLRPAKVGTLTRHPPCTPF